MKPRLYFIDIAKAFSILGVIAIHTYSLHLTSPFRYAVWNFLQFIVITFVFCSGYLVKPVPTISLASFIMSFKKRLRRLYLPFLIYFLVHYSLFFFSPRVFYHFGFQKNVPYVVSSIVLLGGLNTSWLPLLFIELALVGLIFFSMHRTTKVMYLVIASLFTIWITIFHFPYEYYRYIMWLPWSLIYLTGYYLSKHSQKSIYILSFGLSLILFGFSLVYLVPSHQYVFYNNKYPPNLYYLSFGMVGTLTILVLGKVLERLVVVRHVGEYISRKSYSLFFIHFILLDLIEQVRMKSIFWEFCLVALASLFVVILLGQLSKLTTRYLRVIPFEHIRQSA